MTVPKHVMWFQVLLYLSLVLDALSVAFQDRTPTATMTETTILAANVIAACMILLFAYLVRLAAQQRKNWPRWVLTAALVFSVMSLLQVIGASGLQLDSAIEVVSCALTGSRAVCFLHRRRQGLVQCVKSSRHSGALANGERTRNSEAYAVSGFRVRAKTRAPE